MPNIPLDSLKKKEARKEENQSETHRLDFLKHSEIKSEPGFERPKYKKNSWLKVIVILILIFLVSASMYLSELIFSGQGFLSNLNKFNPIKQLAHLIGADDKPIEGEADDRVNFLFLGVGGEGHDGPYLTDTIMIASLKPSTNQVALISIPRDLIVETATGRWQKINSIYALSRSQGEEEAATLVTKTIETNFGVPIHYYLIVDFDGFVKFVDDLGGIEVNVENSFTDYQYPTEDYKIKTVSFEAGTQTMDGETALIFARSRHGNNFEGSDFARGRRQQLVLQAVKDKAASFNTLINPKKISSILNLLENHIQTNLELWEMIKVSNLGKEIDKQNITNLVFDDGPGNFLEASVSEEAGYILRPIGGDFGRIQMMIQNIFDSGKVKQEQAKIEIQNGTPTAGLAYYTQLYLEKSNYQVTAYGNAATQDYQQSVIYDLSGGQKPFTVESLSKQLNAYVVTDIPASILEKYQPAEAAEANAETPQLPDLIVILGKNYSDNFQMPLPAATPTTTATSTEAQTQNEEDNGQENENPQDDNQTNPPLLETSDPSQSLY